MIATTRFRVDPLATVDLRRSRIAAERLQDVALVGVAGGVGEALEPGGVDGKVAF